MLKLDSLYFKLECLVGGTLKARSLVAVKTDVTHCEHPALSFIDFFPGLLLERDDQRWSCNSDLHPVFVEVLIQVLRDLFDLVREFLVLSLRR